MAAEKAERPTKQNEEIDRFLCRALRGEPEPWDALGAVSGEEFLTRCRHHGVSALLHHGMRKNDSWPAWPTAVAQSLEQSSRAGVAQDLLATHYLRQLIAAFAERKIPCLLLKGEALAASIYPDAGTRTRSDSDVLIPIRDIARARQTVLDLGYGIVSPVYKSHQFTVMRPGDRSGNIRFDIHWRIQNAPRFAQTLSFEEAYADSVEVPGLAPARMLSHGDALLVACMHRFGNDRHDRDRLIWINDIRALTQVMDCEAMVQFASRAVERNVQAACLDGLLRSQECFGNRLPDEVFGQLRTRESRQSTVQRLRETQLGLLFNDWCRLEGRADRIGLLKELFLTSGVDLLTRYQKKNRLWLPILYLRRLLGGVYDRFLPR